MKGKIMEVFVLYILMRIHFGWKGWSEANLPRPSRFDPPDGEVRATYKKPDQPPLFKGWCRQRGVEELLNSRKINGVILPGYDEWYSNQHRGSLLGVKEGDRVKVYVDVECNSPKSCYVQGKLWAEVPKCFVGLTPNDV